MLGATALPGEEVTVKQSALLKVDRNVVSVKPGTVVELVSRDATHVTIKYRGLTGKIPVSKLEEPAPGAPTTAASDAPAPREASPAAKPNKQKPVAKKPVQKKPEEKKPAERTPASDPQTGYGKAVKKARDNAAAHDRNVGKPVDEVLKEP